MAFNPNDGIPKPKKEKTLLDTLIFLGEEIILREEKIETEKTVDPFSTGASHEEKDVYGRYKVIKTGKKQIEVKEGDYVLINKNGLPKEINIEGVGAIKDTFSLPTHQRIFCVING